MELKVANIRCGGCANTITKKLSEEFTGVKVDIENGIVTVNEDDEAKLRESLKDLGYPPVDLTLGTFEGGVMKAKSFVSCAIGKVTPKA